MMSKFLTPPVWYDKTGNKIDILNNETYAATGPENTAIGISAIAGRPSSEGISFGAVAVGSQAQAKAPLSIAVGSYNDDNFQTVQALAIGSIAIGAGAKANTDSTDGIAIGSVATSGQGGIAIGAGASATGNQIQLGNNNTAYTLNIGNGNASIGNFKITPIKSGDYANQVILDNVNQIKPPTAGISFEAGERRGVGTIIFPTKIKTNMVESYGYSVSAIAKTSKNGKLTLDKNCLYLITCGGKRSMLHTTQDAVSSDTHQFIYSLTNTQDLVMYVESLSTDPTASTIDCKLQTYAKNSNGGSYENYTANQFTATKVCSFTY